MPRPTGRNKTNCWAILVDGFGRGRGRSRGRGKCRSGNKTTEKTQERTKTNEIANVPAKKIATTTATTQNTLHNNMQKPPQSIKTPNACVTGMRAPITRTTHNANKWLNAGRVHSETTNCKHLRTLVVIHVVFAPTKSTSIQKKMMDKQPVPRKTKIVAAEIQTAVGTAVVETKSCC